MVSSSNAEVCCFNEGSREVVLTFVAVSELIEDDECFNSLADVSLMIVAGFVVVVVVAVVVVVVDIFSLREDAPSF